MPDGHVTIVELTRAGATDRWFGEISGAVEATPWGSHLHVIFPPEHDFWGCVVANLGSCFGMVVTPIPEVHDSVTVFDAVAAALSLSGRPWTWSTHGSKMRRPATSLRERLGRLQPS